MLDAAPLMADMGDHMGDWGAGWWVLMTIGMVVFWGLVILGVVWLVRSTGSAQHHERGLSAIDVLDRRLAQGEISPEEYRERRGMLQGGGS